jgi:hypothetical protein
MNGTVRFRLLAVLSLWVVGSAARGLPRKTDEIVGTWRGSSTCVDRVAAPACNDEQVVYEVVASPDAPERVTIKGDRLVDGKRVFMGDLEYTPAKDGSWTAEFQSPRMHSQWRIVVSGDSMTGTAILLPSKAVVRRLALQREK